MHSVRSTFAVALVVVAALAGCSRQQETVSEMSSDSLLASSPVEQPAGDLTPQADYTQTPAPETPAPAPPRSSSKPSKPRTPRTPPRSTPPSEPAESPGVTLSAGTPIKVSVSTQVSSENAAVGESWSGSVTENVVVGDRVVIPAGSTVEGVVSAAHGAEKGSRAFLVLEVNSIVADGRSIPVNAEADSIIAGSTRARNLGAIAGSAAAGAIIGKTVGGGGKGALIGGLIGGVAATGAVAKSKGYQVVLKEGTVLTFSVSRNVKVQT